jgi:hypothetical protein
MGASVVWIPERVHADLKQEEIAGISLSSSLSSDNSSASPSSPSNGHRIISPTSPLKPVPLVPSLHHHFQCAPDPSLSRTLNPSEPIKNARQAKDRPHNPSPSLVCPQGNCSEELGKIMPRYGTFQCQKCLSVLRDCSQEGEHDREIGIQSRTSKRQGQGIRLRAP